MKYGQPKNTKSAKDRPSEGAMKQAMSNYSAKLQGKKKKC